MTFSHQDSQCMALAMKLSMKGRSTVGANPMVGCVITIDGKVIAQDYHREYGKAHAEVNALDQIKNQAKDAIMYVTLEPCQMCAGALYWSRISNLFYGVKDSKRGYKAMGGRLHPKTKVNSGVLENESKELLENFFILDRLIEFFIRV